MSTVALPLSAGRTIMVSSFCRLRSAALSALVILGLGSLARLTVRTTSLLSSAALVSGLKETKMFLPHPRVKVSIVGSLRDREVVCSASDRQGSNFESCVWRAVSSQSSHHPQEVLLAQFSLYVHKGGLKPDSFHLVFGRCLVTASVPAIMSAMGSLVGVTA